MASSSFWPPSAGDTSPTSMRSSPFRLAALARRMASIMPDPPLAHCVSAWHRPFRMPGSSSPNKASPPLSPLSSLRAASIISASKSSAVYDDAGFRSTVCRGSKWTNSEGMGCIDADVVTVGALLAAIGAAGLSPFPASVFASPALLAVLVAPVVASAASDGDAAVAVAATVSALTMQLSTLTDSTRHPPRRWRASSLLLWGGGAGATTTAAPDLAGVAEEAPPAVAPSAEAGGGIGALAAAPGPLLASLPYVPSSTNHSVVSPPYAQHPSW